MVPQNEWIDLVQNGDFGNSQSQFRDDSKIILNKDGVDHVIKGGAVLKKGNGEFGLIHIRDRNHFKQIKNKFKLENTDGKTEEEVVIDFIKEAYKKGIRQENPIEIIYETNGKKLLIVESSISPGSIQTVYPIK